MSPVDVSVLVRKLALMEERLDLLRPLAALPLEAYRADTVRKKGAEKLLQELINAAVDANYHVLVQAGQPPPEDAFGSFMGLVKLGVLAEGPAQVLAPFSGLRNRLVHEYETLDDAKVLVALRDAQTVFPPYIRALRNRFCPPAP